MGGPATARPIPKPVAPVERLPAAALASVPGKLRSAVLVVADHTLPDGLVTGELRQISGHCSNESRFSADLAFAVRGALEHADQYAGHRLILVVSNNPVVVQQASLLAAAFPGKKVVVAQRKACLDSAVSPEIPVVGLYAHEILRIAERAGIN